MNRKNIFSILFLILAFLIPLKTYSQSRTSFDNLTQFNYSVKKLYEEIISNNITSRKAEVVLDTLKKSPFGNNKEYKELINQVLPRLISCTSNSKDGLRDYYIKLGDDLLNAADSYIQNLSIEENEKLLPDSLKKAISRVDKSLNTSNQQSEQKSYTNLIYPRQKIKINNANNASRDKTKETSVDKTDRKDTKNNSVLTHNAVDPENLGIGNLVIDRTQSVWGRDFVDLFNKYWNPPPSITDYTIIIEEKPLPRFGTVILIKVNGNYVYKRFIQPRYYNIKMNAEQGAQLTLSYVEHYRQIQKSLEGDDMKGTGIY